MVNSRLQRVKLNAVTTLLNQIISTVSGVLLPWVMISAYGSAVYGVTISIAQFLSYISLIEGGIGRVARGELYKPLASSDLVGTERVYIAIKRFFRRLCLLFLAYVAFLAVFYHDFADTAMLTREYVCTLIFVIAIGKFSEYMWGITNVTLLNADQRQYIVNSAVAITNVLNVILVFVFASLGVGVVWVKLISSTVFLLRPVFYTFYVRRHYNFSGKQTEKFELKNKWTGMGQHIAYYLQTGMDVFILTLVTDAKTVAVYSVYHLVLFSIKNIVISLTGGMEALFGNMIAKGEYTELKQAFEGYKLMLTLLVTVLFGTTGVMIVPFVKIYTSGAADANYIQPVFALILMLAEAVNCLTWPCASIAISANKLKETRFGSYGEAAINLAFSAALVFWNPLVGVAIGSLLSVIFKALFYTVYVSKNIVKIKLSKMLFRLSFSVILLSGISVLGMWAVSAVDISGYFMWALICVPVVVSTSVIALIAGQIMYPGEVRDAVRRLLKKSR